MHSKLVVILIILFLNLGNLASANNDWNGFHHSKLRIIPAGVEEDHYLIGLEFQLADGWKLYAPDQDNLGAAPRLDWSEVQNIVSHQIKWPEALHQTDEFGIKSVTYQNQVILPISLTTIDPNQYISGKLNLNYAVCNQVCMPVVTSLDLNLPPNYSNQENLEKINHYLASPANLNITILLIALFGGLILNIMPCVLPVLSIKIFTLLEQRKDLPLKHIRSNFLSTSCGIIFSFLLLASFTSLMLFFGHRIGFGMHFQQPIFIITLVLILVIFACNLMGEFEINLPSKINDLLLRSDHKNRLISHFLSGSFATLMATPCSAPFVGTAISFALSSSYTEIFSIFTMMGIGMALPFLLLSLFPNMVFLLPRPGLWMVYFKKLLSILLFLTIFWLLYVLSEQIGLLPSILLFLITLLIKFSLSNSLFLKYRQYKVIFIGLLIVLGYLLPLNLNNQLTVREEFIDEIWQPAELDKISTLIKENKIVLIDVTANWCLTCKLNKLMALNQPVILNYLKEHHVVAMRADITSSNPKILEFLQKHNRHAIPFNIIFSKDHPDGVVLPEILTTSKLLKNLKIILKN